jgi:hypothetical protein
MTTFIHDNIEFVMPTVFKATMHDWANDIIQHGIVYFTNIKRFVTDTHPERGDANEGRQNLIRNGVQCSTEYPMPVYVWCCTLDTQACRVIQTWPDKNCVMQILDTVEFAQRITNALREQRPKLWPLHVGPVVYTKTSGGYERTDWADGVFQKDERYDGQKEFRFALTARSGDEPEDNVVLELGSCQDIVRIALIINPEQSVGGDSGKVTDGLTGAP